MIDPKMLVDAQSAMPAPVWFVQFFKTLGFTLHSVPMNLWYAGLLVALLLHWFGGEHGRRFAGRFMKQMPVIIAVGVNLGIVPLLFIQLAYYKFFYPATILMAWFWIAIIVLLIPAYYGVYAYAWGLRNTTDADAGPTASRFRNGAAWRTAAGWIAALLFVCIGFLFANGLSLLDHVDRWPELLAAHNVGGAATGTALNVGDPTFFPRWLLMFGLALCTTAVWVLVDAEWFDRAGKVDNENYRRWAWRFARGLYTFGMVWAAGAGAWYVFGTWTEELRTAMFEQPYFLLTAATAVATGLPWLLVMAGGGGKGDSPLLPERPEGCCAQKGTVPFSASRRLAVAAIATAQFGVLGVNAVSRQAVQNMNLKLISSHDVFAQATAVEWSPMVMFLVTFVLALGVIGWMIVQVAKSRTQ